MGKPLIPVATYMASVIEDHIDLATDGVNSTTLAEDAADHFGLMGGPPTYASPDARRACPVELDSEGVLQWKA